MVDVQEQHLGVQSIRAGAHQCKGETGGRGMGASDMSVGELLAMLQTARQ